MTAINLEDDLGVRYLEVGDFLRNGIPASLLSTSVILTVRSLDSLRKPRD